MRSWAIYGLMVRKTLLDRNLATLRQALFNWVKVMLFQFLSLFSLWFISIHCGKWFWMAATLCWRRLSSFLFYRPIFCRRLGFADNTMPLSVPNIAEIASSPPPSFVYWRRLSTNMCQFYSINFIISYIHTVTPFSHLWSTLENLIEIASN